MGPVHWDDAPAETLDRGCLRRTRWDLGAAAGSRAVGLKRVRAQAGGQTSPVHAHSREEEIFFVLDGSGRLWQDGEACEIGAGDAIVHVAGGPAHTIVAGDGAIDVLAFGERRDAEGAFLPRAGVAWHGDTWVEAGGGEHPFAREAALEPVDVGRVGARPANVVALADVAAERRRRGATDLVKRDLATAGGSVTSGLKHFEIAPGAESYPPHCHSAEEELFVVLRGAGVLRLDDEEHAVARGSVVARPAGTGVAHSFVAGADGLELLAYGERDPRDVCWYPRSQKLSVRGVGAMFRVQRVDYWDGEE
ncbi:MAG TPA: cupin domain-containing protein [Solirubrobacteraceae bacterium]|nr:cupin domain-containing protein [Solirubrobacteraceae bacterium]